MIPEHGPLTFEVEARNAIDNELNVPLGQFYYSVMVFYMKNGEKMLMVNPATGWPGFRFANHDALLSFIGGHTVIQGIPLSPATD